jgi:hypothetical protein
MRFTVVSAAKFETEPITKTSFHRLVDEYIEIGVGVLDSMYLLPGVIERLRNKNIIFIGTAGRFGTFFSPELVCASEVQWLPTGDRLKKSYSVPQHSPLNLDPIAIVSRDLLPATVVCGPSVSTDVPTGFHDAKSSVVENIELYGVAVRVVPVASSFTAILGITNAVGPNSHIQWKANWSECATKTADFLALIAGELDAI